MNGIKKIFCMFVVTSQLRRNPKQFIYDKRVPMGIISERGVTPVLDCGVSPTGTLAYKNFFEMTPKKDFVNVSQYANISTPHSAKTVQSNRTQIGFKPQNSRGKKHKITQLTQEPVKETNQYLEIVSKAFFEFLQDEAENVAVRADANFKDKINAARLLFPNDRKNLKQYLNNIK